MNSALPLEKSATMTKLIDEINYQSYCMNRAMGAGQLTLANFFGIDDEQRYSARYASELRA